VIDVTKPGRQSRRFIPEYIPTGSKRSNSCFPAPTDETGETEHGKNETLIAMTVARMPFDPVSRTRKAVKLETDRR